ncbi:Non-reducing end beta-L-arabinofuranosidase [bioreactor metagenome]|uniref:Non-reducing end beta-L-arabinofuranosidase n=2 Tax=root TaxID=1 RepID=A0A645A6G4_9ZZZZ
MTLVQETSYPWDGNVTLTVESLKKSVRKEFRLRIPGWCKNYTVAVNGESITDPLIEKGYLVIDRKWKSGDKVTLALDMPAETVQADPRVKENSGKRAVQRGPIVYCAEETDNPSFDELTLSPPARFKETFNPTLLNGVTTIDAVSGDDTIRFIPYYAWDNREAGQMKVWMNYNE